MPEINKNEEIMNLRAKSENLSLGFDNIENIVKAAEEAIPEGVVDIRRIQEDIDVNPDADLESEEVITSSSDGHRFGIVMGSGATSNKLPELGDGSDEIDRIAAAFENQVATGVSLFDIDSNGRAPQMDDRAINTSAEFAKGTFDLPDEDVLKLINTLNNMRKDPNFPVYANLPEKMQLVISKLAYENKIPVTKLESISRSMMQEFLNEAGVDNALVDLEKAIDEALNIPSIVDLYSEHTRDVMENIIPRTIDSIKDEFPEKAQMLARVKAAFTESYNYSIAKVEYLSNARLRKTIRRYEREFTRTLDLFNYQNEKSNFKMNDVRHMPEVLSKLLIEDPNIAANMAEESGESIEDLDAHILDLAIEEKDIQKFCILMCKHCENRNPNDVIDAAYMYYLVRNIIALRHTQEAKTDFAVELINNICDVITFIRDKEREFDESNMDKSKSSKKSNSKKRNHK